MILMAVYVIGNLSLLLRPVVLSIWEKAMEFWHGWRDASDFAAHAYGKGMRDMCTYHSSLLHVSTVENTITLLFFSNRLSASLPSFLHLPNLCRYVHLR